jgi:hypothetical protein
MIYPQIATTQPPAMIGPLALILSEKKAVSSTKKNATTFGGAVNAWALVEL